MAAVDESEVGSKSEEVENKEAKAEEQKEDDAVDLSGVIHSGEDEFILECIALAFKTNDKIKWKTTAEKDGVIMEVTKDDCFQSFNDDKKVSSGLQIVRGDTTVEDITPAIYYTWMEGYHDAHVVWEKEFEKTCTESKVVAYIDIDHTIAYTSYDPGYYVVSPRDFCYMKRRIYLKNFDPFHPKPLSECRHHVTVADIENEDNNEESNVEADENRSETLYDEIALYIYYDIHPSHSNYIDAAPKHVRANCIGGNIFARKTRDSPVELLWVSRMDLRGWIPTWLVNMAVSSKVDSVGQLKENMKIVVNREKKKRLDEMAAREAEKADDTVEKADDTVEKTDDTAEKSDDTVEKADDTADEPKTEEESQSQPQNKDSEVETETDAPPTEENDVPPEENAES